MSCTFGGISDIHPFYLKLAHSAPAAPISLSVQAHVVGRVCGVATGGGREREEVYSALPFWGLTPTSCARAGLGLP